MTHFIYKIRFKKFFQNRKSLSFSQKHRDSSLKVRSFSYNQQALPTCLHQQLGKETNTAVPLWITHTAHVLSAVTAGQRRHAGLQHLAAWWARAARRTTAVEQSQQLDDTSPEEINPQASQSQLSRAPEVDMRHTEKRKQVQNASQELFSETHFSGKFWRLTTSLQNSRRTVGEAQETVAEMIHHYQKT